MQSLDRLKENEDWLDSVKEVATEIYEAEKTEIESQTLLELVPKLDWWVLVAVGVGLVALIVVFIFFLRKRKSLGQRGKVLATLGQIGFSALLVVFLVIMANSEKQYVPDVSLAGCVEQSPGSNMWSCDSYAELTAQRAQQNEEAGVDTKESRATKRAADEIFGEDGWKDVTVGDTQLDSENSDSAVLRNAYDTVIEGLEEKEKANSIVKGIDELSDCQTASTPEKIAACEQAFASYLSVASPVEYMEQQYKIIVEQDKQERLNYCYETLSQSGEEAFLAECVGNVNDKFAAYELSGTDYDSVMAAIDDYESDNELYNLTIDPVTKSIIRTSQNHFCNRRLL